MFLKYLSLNFSQILTEQKKHHLNFGGFLSLCLMLFKAPISSRDMNFLQNCCHIIKTFFLEKTSEVFYVCEIPKI